jgi:hypothetical protein
MDFVPYMRAILQPKSKSSWNRVMEPRSLSLSWALEVPQPSAKSLVLGGSGTTSLIFGSNYMLGEDRPP